MSDKTDYSPRQQFRRALALDWSLYGVDLVAGVFYVLAGFYAGRRVGYSQVYNVIGPCLFVSAYLVYLTWHMCAPGARRATALYFFNLPQERSLALSAHLTFLFLGTACLTALVLVGCALKLGGAGITACYRIHPEFMALPFLTVAATVWHVHCVHGWGHWGRVALLFVVLCSWFAWKLYMIDAHPPLADNKFWPKRDMSIWIQLIVAGMFIGISWWLLAKARVQWRRRQIGVIQ